MHCSDNCMGGVGVTISFDLGVMANRRIRSISPDLSLALSTSEAEDIRSKNP